MARVRIEGAGRFSCHYPKLAVVVTAQVKGKANAMAVAWHSSISSNPPLYGISITTRRLTYKLIMESGKFGINFMPFEKADLVASVGGVTGRRTDKFEQFGIAKDESVEASVPVLWDAYACYECNLVDHHAYGDHEWVVGEVVATHFLEEVLTSDGELEIGKVNPTLYAGSERYVTAQGKNVRLLDRHVYGKRGRA